MKWWVTLSTLFLLVAAGTYQGVSFLNRPPSSYGVYKTIDIPEGISFRLVSDLLANEGLITNRIYFRWLARWTQKDKKAKSGEYTFHTALRPMALLDLLVEGRVLLRQVVAPEGVTSREIGGILEKAGLVSSDIFYESVRDPDLLHELEIEGESLEGYLFPDTYQFAKRTPPIEIVRRMVAQFKTVYSEPFRRRADELGMTQTQVVTLASIIEKETAHPSERTLISAVFHNRLKRKMPLQSDPTVIFAIKDFNGNLTRKDLSTPSPYNTYMIKGLPPGPIANPGKEALYAVLYPEEVDYLYFVSKNNGTHHFSRTLSEHNAAVNLYQRRKMS